MQNKKIYISILKIISQIVSYIFITVAAGIIFCLISLIVIKLTGTYSYEIKSIYLPIFIFVYSLVLLLFLLKLSSSITKILKNINNNIYISKLNLKYIRSINSSLLSVIVLQVVMKLIQIMYNINNISSIYTSWSNIALLLLLLLATYTTYLIFSYGLNIKNENNKFI